MFICATAQKGRKRLHLLSRTEVIVARFASLLGRATMLVHSTYAIRNICQSTSQTALIREAQTTPNWRGMF